MDMKRSFAAFAILACALAGPAKAVSEMVDRIAAVVGDQVITLHELKQAYENDALGLKAANPLIPEQVEAEGITRKDYLEKMVESILVEQEVESQGINVSAIEIEKAIERQKKKLGIKDEQFLELLEQQGITLEQYRNKVKQDLVTIRLIGKEVRSEVEITDDEVLTYYRQHTENFVHEDQVSISILSLAVAVDASEAESRKTREMMKGLRRRIIEGEDFADLARECSIAGIPAQGGEMGWFKTKELKPGFAIAVKTLDRGEVSEPFQLENSWHIIKVNEWKKGQGIPFEQARDQIRELLYQKEVKEKYDQWLERLKARSHVEIRL
jgi:peptidyl-prolyl cis-trans isomerase SurA